MFILPKLALRNIARNKARSALTLGAIFAGVLMTLLLSGFGYGLRSLMIDDIIFSKVGAIQVHAKGYAQVKDNQDLTFNLPQSDAFAQQLLAIPHIAAVTPRMTFSGMVSNGREATMFIGRGVDPTHEYDVLPWSKSDIVGSPIQQDKSYAGVMGAELARALGIHVNDTVIVQATTLGKQQNALDLSLAGTLDNVNIFEAQRVIHLPLAMTQELLRMPGRVTEYMIRVDDKEAVSDIATTLRQHLGDNYEVETWQQLQPTLADAIRFQQIVITIICGVFLVIVVFGVINTMMMAVMERTREIGTMMAMGVKRRRISQLFLAEAAFLALIGGISGLLVSRLLIHLVTLYGGFAVAAPGSTIERYHIFPIVTQSMEMTTLLASTLGALIAAGYPAWRASKLRPVDALRAV